MNAYSYLRVSGKSQIEGDGFPRQRKAIAALPFTIVEEFTEDGVTGEAAWTDRPAFQRMIRQILDGTGPRTVVVENLTRLARAYTIQEPILIYMASKGIDLISADSGENITEAIKENPMKKALIQMQAVFSELEKATLVSKLKAARQRKKEKTGRCEGRKPYGHYPGEQSTLGRMKELRRKPQGKPRPSYAAVAAALTAEGLLPRSGKAWSAGSVFKILTVGV